MQPDVLQSQIALARNVASQGGKILVVGIQPDSVGQDLLTHPRLEFYDVKADRGSDTREIPPNTRLVLFTRWASHRTQDHFRKLANKRGVHCLPVHHSTGELRKILTEAKIVSADKVKAHESDGIDYDRVEPHTPVVVEQVPEGKVKGLHGGYYTRVEMKKGQDAPRGATFQFAREWCEHHYGGVHAVPKRISNRDAILAEARHVGILSSQPAIMQAFVKARELARMTPPPAAQAPPAAPEATTPVAEPLAQIHSLSAEHPIVKDCVQMVNEAIVGLELLKERILRDYATIDAIVNVRVKERLKAIIGEA